MTARNADAAERWAEAVRRFTTMTVLELRRVEALTASGYGSPEDWAVISVSALDQSGLDVARLKLVPR